MTIHKGTTMNKTDILKVLNKTHLTDKIALVIGTRPGIIMFSPIIRVLTHNKINFFIIHSGQHYSYNMDGILFEQLEIPQNIIYREFLRKICTGLRLQ